MTVVLELLGWIFLLGGGLLGIVGGIGMLRFPDFYTRLHAGGITDTLCTLLIIIGLMLALGWNLGLAKLLMILIFVLFTSPTATHALARAALHGGLQPKTGEQKPVTPDRVL